MTGGQYGLTCPPDLASIPNANGSNANGSNANGSILCKDLTIPDCVDRTVYCTDPPGSTPEESLIVNTNPSAYYQRTPGLPIVLYCIVFYVFQMPKFYSTCSVLFSCYIWEHLRSSATSLSSFLLQYLSLPSLFLSRFDFEGMQPNTSSEMLTCPISFDRNASSNQCSFHFSSLLSKHVTHNINIMQNILNSIVTIIFSPIYVDLCFTYFLSLEKIKHWKIKFGT